MIKIVVPFYNAEMWIERCLNSIYHQDYKDYKCIVVNDASTDNSKNILENMKHIQEDNRFLVIHNKENVNALTNIFNAFKNDFLNENKEDILMAIDGDDFLSISKSLQIVFDYYSNDKNLLLTYGNWIGWPNNQKSNCRLLDDHVINNNLFRDIPFCYSHLRSFKRKLWDSIPENLLKDSDNNFYKVAWDVAFMIPMLEMARERIKFIPDILYCYNVINPISDDKINSKDQVEIDRKIRKLEKLNRLEF